MKTYLYGGSDDLIEIDGAITDEIGCYDVAEKGIKFSASDGTTGLIKYDGEWRIEIYDPGTLILNHYKSVGDEMSHPGDLSKFTAYKQSRHTMITTAVVGGLLSLARLPVVFTQKTPSPL